MRWTVPLLGALVAALALAGPAEARQRCDVPNKPGVHIKFSIGSGHRDYETQQQFDMMALRQRGIDPRSVTRTGDGCIEAWIPNGDGTFRNEYYDPDDLNGGPLKLTLD